MAEVRGSMGLALANIRAFLLFGDAKFEKKFKAMWSKTSARYSFLNTKTDLLNPEQKAAFAILQGREKYLLPSRHGCLKFEAEKAGIKLIFG